METVLSPNCWPDRSGYAPKWIIVHGTAGFETAAQVAAFFGSTASQVSSHYIVDREGVIIQCVQESAAAWADGGVTGPPGISGDGVHHDFWWDTQPNPNLVTISIEHVKPSTDNSDQLTQAQQAASFALVTGICARWGIPKRYADQDGGITGHYSMDPVNKSRCPGPYPWTTLWGYLQQQGGIMVPQGWSDNGSVLTAPNGIQVTQGFRSFVLSNQWDPTNWPIEASIGKTPLELANPSLGGGTRQLFRWTTLEWTPSRGVFVAWTGLEIAALEAKIVALQTPTPTPPAQSQPTQKAS